MIQEKQVTIFTTQDGKEFKTRQDAVKHLCDKKLFNILTNAFTEDDADNIAFHIINDAYNIHEILSTYLNIKINQKENE